MVIIVFYVKCLILYLNAAIFLVNGSERFLIKVEYFHMHLLLSCDLLSVVLNTLLLSVCREHVQQANYSGIDPY